jgi:IclR family transcriptional regulator, KDG regulon repressor
MLLTVERVGQVLDLYNLEATEWGPTEAGAALGMSKQKAHTLMASMAEIGLLRRVGNGRYRIGWRAVQLDTLVSGSAPFRPVAHQVAVRLVRHTGETVHVGALDKGQVRYIDTVVGASGLRGSRSAIGAVLPAHCTGVGKALLAHLNQETVGEILDRRGLTRFTPATIVDRAQLLSELSDVRQTGLAYDREEVVSGVRCVAAPISDGEGSVVAAISLTAPTQRLQQHADAYRNLIVKAARTISAALRDRGGTLSGVARQE